jgi:diadenosine tetraphosphate (Ap4A) HIT family hydrolase
MENCVFCKIAKGETDSAIIWENEEFFAILDINPNTKGMALVIPKVHYDSYVFDMHDDVYGRFFAAAKTVAGILEKGLEVSRVALVIEGMGVNHAHLKLYPMHGVGKEFKECWCGEKIFFDNYPGYISTQLGLQVGLPELKKIARDMKSKN